MATFIWTDYVIIGIIGLSSCMGALRGLLKEMFAILTWAGAIWIGSTFYPQLAPKLAGFVSIPAIRLSVAFAILFFTTLFLGGLCSHVISRFVQTTGLTGSDRLAGIVFGMVRGVLLVVILLLLLEETPLTRESWWQKSVTIATLHPVVVWLKSMLPASIVGHLASI